MLSWKNCQNFKNKFENFKPHIDTDFGMIAFFLLFQHIVETYCHFLI